VALCRLGQRAQPAAVPARLVGGGRVRALMPREAAHLAGLLRRQAPAHPAAAVRAAGAAVGALAALAARRCGVTRAALRRTQQQRPLAQQLCEPSLSRLDCLSQLGLARNRLVLLPPHYVAPAILSRVVVVVVVVRPLLLVLVLAVLVLVVVVLLLLLAGVSQPRTLLLLLLLLLLLCQAPVVLLRPRVRCLLPAPPL
jgi:hypothetical protein